MLVNTNLNWFVYRINAPGEQVEVFILSYLATVIHLNLQCTLLVIGVLDLLCVTLGDPQKKMQNVNQLFSISKQSAKHMFEPEYIDI